MPPSLAWLNHEHHVPISASPSSLQNSQSVVFLIVCSILRAVFAYCAICLLFPRPLSSLRLQQLRIAIS